MKPRVLSAVLLAALVVSSVSVQAASDIAKTAGVKPSEADRRAPAAGVRAGQKAHGPRRVNEQTSVPQKAPQPQFEKPNPATDMRRHHQPQELE